MVDCVVVFDVIKGKDLEDFLLREIVFEDLFLVDIMKFIVGYIKDVDMKVNK